MAEDAKPITKASAVSEKEVKEVQKSVGYYNVKFLKDHGTYSKGHEKMMVLSTAKALAAHKVVEVGEKVKTVTKPKR